MIYFLFYFFKTYKFKILKLGIGDWGLGVGDWEIGRAWCGERV